jgi:hypothetical protein
MPADPIEKSGFRTAGGGRRIFRDANATIGFGNDGKGSPGRLPPVVSSLFSVKAAHWRDGIRGTELGARGKERTARQRRVIRVKGCASRGEGSSTSMIMSGTRDAAVCHQWIRKYE